MDERPPKLPFAATRVIKASRLLGAGQKLVWLEDWALDGPEGAWISGAHLAVRLGMSRQNVDQHRQHLQALGLHTVIARPGARTDGWRPTLPPACIPPLRPTVEQVMRCAAALDDALQRAATMQPSLRSDGKPTCSPEASPLASGSPEAPREGGRGEGSLLSRRGRETTLQPHEDGEVARATKGKSTAEDGGETLAQRVQRFREMLR
jgi:hypothetical protein